MKTNQEEEPILSDRLRYALRQRGKAVDDSLNMLKFMRRIFPFIKWLNKIQLGVDLVF